MKKIQSLSSASIIPEHPRTARQFRHLPNELRARPDLVKRLGSLLSKTTPFWSSQNAFGSALLNVRLRWHPRPIHKTPIRNLNTHATHTHTNRSHHGKWHSLRNEHIGPFRGHRIAQDPARAAALSIARSLERSSTGSGSNKISNKVCAIRRSSSTMRSTVLSARRSANRDRERGPTRERKCTARCTRRRRRRLGRRQRCTQLSPNF